MKIWARFYAGDRFYFGRVKCKPKTEAVFAAVHRRFGHLAGKHPKGTSLFGWTKTYPGGPDFVQVNPVNGERIEAKETLADHAEFWAKQNGEQIPPRETAEWQEMYERWIDWAFADFTEA